MKKRKSYLYLCCRICACVRVCMCVCACVCEMCVNACLCYCVCACMCYCVSACVCVCIREKINSQKAKFLFVNVAFLASQRAFFEYKCLTSSKRQNREYE